MYSSYIGKRFLDIYQQKTGEQLNAREFFLRYIFELFYNHKKYFKWIVNSPFVQALPKSERTKTFAEQQLIKLNTLIHKVDHCPPDSSFAVGFPSADLTFDTSGQVSSGVFLPMDANEIFASWIGAGFGLKVEGEQVWLIDDDEILWTIFEGWPHYRELLNSSVVDVKGNDVDAWNSAWVQFCYDVDKISPQFRIENHAEVPKKGKWIDVYLLKPPSWVHLVFHLARHFKGKQLMVYSSHYISKKQKSETIGFIKFALPEVDKFYQLFERTFKKSTIVKNARLLDLYRARFSFDQAAQMGVIGLSAIEPEQLRDTILEGSQTNRIIYKLWVVAMLDKKELVDSATSTAEWLYDYAANSSQSTRGKRDQQVKQVLNARTKVGLLEALIEISENDLSRAGYVQTIKNQIMAHLQDDRVRLYVALIRIDYCANNASVKSQEH